MTIYIAFFGMFYIYICHSARIIIYRGRANPIICYELEWRHTDVMPSQITSHSTVCLTLFRLTHRRRIESPHYWPFVRGIHRSPADSPHKGPVMWKAFPCHAIVMCTIQKRSAAFDLTFNSLDPGRCSNNFKSIIFKHIVQNSGLDICRANATLNLTNEK